MAFVDQDFIDRPTDGSGESFDFGILFISQKTGFEHQVLELVIGQGKSHISMIANF
jgi:hypothetical protein